MCLRLAAPYAPDHVKALVLAARAWDFRCAIEQIEPEVPDYVRYSIIVDAGTLRCLQTALAPFAGMWEEVGDE